ncbi:unnamed protein product [Cochlearia groenlandica]
MEYSLKSLASILIVMVLAMSALETGPMVRAQQCNVSLSNMQACAPLVLPGAVNPKPNSDCCVALQSTNKDCLCNALRAATTLTSLCNIPSFDCATVSSEDLGSLVCKRQCE